VHQGAAVFGGIELGPPDQRRIAEHPAFAAARHISRNRCSAGAGSRTISSGAKGAFTGGKLAMGRPRSAIRNLPQGLIELTM
jgi:hypothetical protein